MESVVEIGLKLTYVLMVIGALAAVVMPIVQAITSDPKSLVKALIGVGAIVVVYGLGYAIAGDEVTAKYVEFDVDASLSKTVGGLLYTMYILMLLAIGGIVFTEVSKAVN